MGVVPNSLVEKLKPLHLSDPIFVKTQKAVLLEICYIVRKILGQSSHASHYRLARIRVV